MAVRVLVGAQWGDEGKGKVVDWLGRDADIIARYAGGPNAGHTVVVAGEKTILHHVPSGILSAGTKCLLGNGVVVDSGILLKEIETLEAGGVECAGRILISPRAHVILGTHRTLDRVSEEARGVEAIGTTGKGIGPAYGDKVLRRGVRVGDLLDPKTREARVRAEVEEMNRVLEGRYGASPIDPQEILDEARQAGEVLGPMVADTGTMLRDAIRLGRGVLLEGAQGTLLDLDHGTYPYATSSSATSGGACTGCGIPPTAIDSIWGVTKAYCTRVGNGPFPTEMTGPEGDELREKGGEYGATTGRPRRCGWFDAVAGRYAVEVNGLDAMAVTKLDILTGIDPIRVCVAYKIDGVMRTDFPDSAAELKRAEPVYEDHAGWKEPIHDVRRPEDLPVAARAYLQRLSDL
ncbi:MAG: adenylosuccinate synthase, partial [Gemmatimonadetes bacterium]|nr:adenylosuccinate synthase [Gemmatimonadota bacterium]